MLHQDSVEQSRISASSIQIHKRHLDGGNDQDFYNTSVIQCINCFKKLVCSACCCLLPVFPDKLWCIAFCKPWPVPVLPFKQ